MDPRYTSKTGVYARLKRAEALREVYYKADVNTGDESDSSDDIEDDYVDIFHQTGGAIGFETSADYWRMRKLSSYLNRSTKTLVKLTLVLVQCCGLENPVMIQALKDNNSINLMINILESDDCQVQLASLRCLKDLTLSKAIRYEIVYFGGLETIVSLLWLPFMKVRSEAAQVIARTAIFQRAWKIVRKCSGVQLLTNMIDLPKKIREKTPENLNKEETDFVEAAAMACDALYSLCEDEKNRKIFWNEGTLKLSHNILLGHHTELQISFLTLLQRCAEQQSIRVDIRETHMLHEIRKLLFSNNQMLMQASAQTIFKCAEDFHSREFFGSKGYVEELCKILSTSQYHTDARFMASITGALWKCAKSRTNVDILHSQNTVQLLTQLILSQPLEVQVHIVGCLAIAIKQRQCLVVARKNGFIDTAVGLLSTIHPPLIKNLNKAIAEASKEPESMAIIDKTEAVRLVWSHLQNNDDSVITTTAWSLYTLLKNMKDTSVYLRSLGRGLLLVVQHLSSKYTSVLTPLCAIIAELGKNIDNVPILTDFRIIDNLSRLTNNRCKRLRYYLCLAIANCCKYKTNRQEFAERGIMPQLLKFFNGKTAEVRGAACHAVYQMSLLPSWCAVIHGTKGVLHTLSELMDSKDASVQNHAALTLQNMRYFSMIRQSIIPDFFEKRIIEIDRGLLTEMTETAD